MRNRIVPLSLFALLIAAGCGGGGSSLSSGPLPEKQIGPMSVQGAEKVLAPDVVPGGATLYGLTGSIAKISMVDANPTLEETEIYFLTGKGAGHAIMACSPNGGGLRTVCSASEYAKQIKVIGSWVYFVVVNPNTFAIDLMRAPVDGGTAASVKTNISRYAPNLAGNKIYGYQEPSANWPNGRFVSFNLDGSSTVNMFAAPFAMGAGDHFAGLLSDGSLVLADYQGAGQNLTVFRAYSAAGAIRQGGHNFPGPVTHTSMDNGTDYVYYKAVTYLERFLAAGTGEWTRVIYTARDDSDISVSPGNKSVAFSNNSIFASLGVLVGSEPFFTAEKIYPQPANAVGWGPLVRSRQFVGSSGKPASVGAFLFSEKGSVLPAVVWADAATRNTIVLTKVSPDGALNTVYSLTCDEVTKLSYTDSLNYAPINVITAPAGIIGVLISLNSDTGRVESLSTFSSAPSVEQTGDGLRVSGVDAVYRPDGRVERAPGVLTFK